MEGLHKVWYDHIDNFCRFPKHVDVKYDPLLSEVVSSPSGSLKQRQVHEYRRPVSEVVQRGFEVPGGIPTGRLRDPCAQCLSIVWITSEFLSPHNVTLEITKQDLWDILDAFGLQGAFKSGFLRGGGIHFAELPAEEDRGILICNAYLFNFGFCWRYDVHAKRTCGVFWGPQVVIERMRSILTNLCSIADHPMFLALLMSIYVEIDAREGIFVCLDRVIAVENRTKHHSLPRPRIEVATENFASLSRMMSGTATRLAQLGWRSGVAMTILDEIDGYRDRSSIQSTREFDKAAKAVNHILQHTRGRIIYYTRRTDIQINVVGLLDSQVCLRS